MKVLRSPGTRNRAGITLTEILISILIMGIGITSLMTLFLYGMINARAADRYSRSAFLAHSAGSDITTRGVLNKSSFKNHVSGVYYYDSAYTPWPYDPWLQDTPGYTAGKWLDPIEGTDGYGAYRGNGSFNTLNPTPHNKPAPFDFVPGTGLPVAYDPLWRVANNTFPGAATEARFASGIGWVRNDPNPGTGAGSSTLPSAHGLQRITNIPSGFPVNVPDIFVSPEDIVLQSATDASKGAGTISPIVPDLGIVPLASTPNGIPVVSNDWKYTWMYTGYQTTTENISAFEGDMVIFENRPFAVDPVTPPITSTPAVVSTVAGEQVVEAIFGYTGRVTAPTGSTMGYGTQAGKGVLLRWPATMPDPEIKTGGWIADVTYERNAAVDYKRSVADPDSGNAGTRYPYQRCYWYLIAKRTEPGPAANSFKGDATAGMREMTVWTSTPLKAFTMLNVSDGSPYHVNAALVSPYVVNVYPRSFVSR